MEGWLASTPNASTTSQVLSLFCFGSHEISFSAYDQALQLQDHLATAIHTVPVLPPVVLPCFSTPKSEKLIRCSIRIVDTYFSLLLHLLLLYHHFRLPLSTGAIECGQGGDQVSQVASKVLLLLDQQGWLTYHASVSWLGIPVWKRMQAWGNFLR